MDFSKFGISDRLLRGMKAGGLHVPTPFQSLLLQRLIEGKNVFGIAPPAADVIPAIVLPVLQQSASGTPGDRQDRSPRALILTTNRDRARNLQRSALSYGRFLSLRTVALYGGVTVESQLPLLQQGAEILVATPERLLEHLEQESVALSKIGLVVIDEADGLLEAGLHDQVNVILSRLPEPRQVFIVAAQLSDALRAFVGSLIPTLEEVRYEAPIEEVRPHRSAPSHHGVREKRGGGTSARGGHPARRRPPAKGGNTRNGEKSAGVGGYASHARHTPGRGPGGKPTSSGGAYTTGRSPGGKPTHSGGVYTAGRGQGGKATHSGGVYTTGRGPGGKPTHSGGMYATGRGPGGKPTQSGGVYRTGQGPGGKPTRPGHATHPAKGKKRRATATTMAVPRKKRPPKKMDSFSSDRGGAGWSGY